MTRSACIAHLCDFSCRPTPSLLSPGRCAWHHLLTVAATTDAVLAIKVMRLFGPSLSEGSVPIATKLCELQAIGQDAGTAAAPGYLMLPEGFGCVLRGVPAG